MRIVTQRYSLTMPLWALTLVWTAGAARAANFNVGFAAVDTSPTAANGYGRSLSGVSLGGYGSSCATLGIGRRGASSIHDKVYARALVIESGAEKLALVMIDATGAGNRTTTRIQQQAAAATGIPANRIFVGLSHSHSAPDLVGLWAQANAVNNADFKAHRDFVISKAVNAVTTAWNNRAGAELLVSSGSFGRATNRRGWGFTDTDLTVLDAKNATTGARIGTLVAWAAHPVVLGSGNRAISRDYQGYAVDALEASLGAGKVAYWNGAFGDASPQAISGDFAGAQELGNALASAALGVMSSATTVDAGLRLATTSFTQCVTNGQFNLAFSLGCMDYNTTSYSGCSRAIASYAAYVRLGTKVQLVLTPGESTTRLAIGGGGLLGIKEVMSPSTVHVLLDPSPDFLGYLIPCDEFNNPPPGDDAYEEGVSLGSCADAWIANPLKSLIQADVF